MRAGKIVALSAGVLITLVALFSTVNGGLLLSAYCTQRDSDGLFPTERRVLASNGAALVVHEDNLAMGPLKGAWLPTGDRSEFRIEVTSLDDSQLFVGIALGSDLTTYFESADYDEVTEFTYGSHSVEYRHVGHAAGTGLMSPPGEQAFWVAHDEGVGTLTLKWSVAKGTVNPSAVIMNADGSAPVQAEVRLGARFDRLLPIGIGVTAVGVGLLGVGTLLIVLGARRPAAPPDAQG